MSPKIQSQQLNKLDLSKLKNANVSMPQVENKNNDKLAAGLSGSTNFSFGKLSGKNSLESSLSIKAGQSESATETAQNQPQADNNSTIFSYTEQVGLKSSVNTIQSDILNATHSSIFSGVKAGSSAGSPSASSSDFSSKAMAQTYLASAKDFAAQAETYAKNSDWENVTKLYTKAQKALEEAQKEIKNASKNGEDITDISAETSNLMTRYSQNKTSANNILNNRTFKTNLTSCTSNDGQTANGFVSSLQSGLKEGIANMFAVKQANNSNNAGNAGGAGGNGVSNPSKNTPSSTANALNSSNNNKLQYDKQYENVIPQEAKTKFENAAKESGDSALAVVNAQKEMTGINSEIDKITSDIDKINGETETYLEDYHDAVKAQAENQQAIDKETAVQTEQQKLFDEANTKCGELTTKESEKSNAVKEDNAAVKQADNELSAANKKVDAQEGTVSNAQSQLTSKQAALATAKQNLASADEKTKASAQAQFDAAQRDFDAAEKTLKEAKEKLTEFKQDVIEKEQAKREADQKLKTDEAELKQIQADAKTYSTQKKNAEAKLKQSKANMTKYEGKQSELAEKAKSTNEVLSKAKGDAANLKTRIDEAYKNQTAKQKIIDTNMEKFKAAQTNKQTAQDLANHAVEAQKNKNSKGFVETLKGLF